MFSYLIGDSFLANRVKCVFSSSQPSGQREQQHRDVAHVINVRSKFSGIAGSDFLSDFKGHVMPEGVIRRALLRQHGLLGFEDLQLLSQPLDKLLL